MQDFNRTVASKYVSMIESPRAPERIQGMYLGVVFNGEMALATTLPCATPAGAMIGAHQLAVMINW